MATPAFQSQSLAELVAEFADLRDALSERLKQAAIPFARAGLEADLTLHLRKAQNGGVVKIEMTILM